MKLEDALKESDIPAAKRVENDYQAVIRFLPNSQGVLMRRVFPVLKQSGMTEFEEEEERFPHLGALIYKAIKKRYTEVRRYAQDWQPLLYATGEKAQAAWRAALAKENEEEEEEEYHNIEDEFTYIDSTGDEDDLYDMETVELYSSDFLDNYGY